MKIVEKWFVVKCPRDEKGHVLIKEYTVISEGFRTREMCEIEVKKFREVYDNHIFFVSSRKMDVKIDNRAEMRRLETYGESNYAERKIFEAIAEYQRCNEW